MKFRLIPSLACAMAFSFLSTVQAQTMQTLPVDSAEQQFYPPGGDIAASCQFLDDTWHSLEDGLYAPFSTYTMTPQQQAAYLAMIHSIW